MSASAHAQIVTLAAEVVSAARLPQAPEQVAATVRQIEREALQAAPTATLDGALRAIPGFSLFRRSDSFSANPTAQGVSLRGLGPSGASRSLVLLDGVPLNDPFGGWVAWSKVPREGLARVEIVPGGGATAWGNAALGGVVQAFTFPGEAVFALGSPLSPFYATAGWPKASTYGRAAVTFGDFGTRSVEILVTQPAGRGSVQLLGRSFATDGFALIAPERRGSVDVGAWSRHRWLAVRWRTQIGEKLEFTATARGFEESRGNGTPYTRNGSREKFFSTSLAGALEKNFVWHAVAYAQDQSFASTFSGVNAARTAETPASDQFAVPATAFGAEWSGVWRHAEGARTSAGGDVRTVRGETRENFTFVAGNFTRQRFAGGDQRFVGAFVLHEQPLTKQLHVTFGGRIDFWRDASGHRRETDRTTGAALRDDHYATESDAEFAPSVGLVWAPAKGWRARVNVQQAFRRPTLNELYRPFRQGANVTEANATLRTEHVTTGEVGVEWTPAGPSFPARQDHHGAPMPSRPAPFSFSATAFLNDLRDAVGNVTIARGPGTFPIVGTLAAGGLGRQRRNLDRTRTQGVELSAAWHFAYRLSLTGDILFNDATVRRAAVAPGLVGKQIAQVPRRSAALGATWRAPGQFTFTPRVRWIGRQFEDDENLLRLGEVVVADLNVSRPISKHLELFLTAENLGNARVETGRSADGVVNVGTPRLVLGGVRGRW
ncbi:MAG: TonB-dependent receptor [Opitutaceae bacterium]|nr:TonB-dependent receptor [Opitutaceae bacterium]